MRIQQYQQRVIYIIMAGLVFSGCSSLHFGSSQSTEQAPAASNTVGGLTAPTNAAPVSERSMDEIDRNKLSHALDAGIGKATSWVNTATGARYTVVPTQKVSVGGNPFCRKYKIATERNGSSKEVEGTACVATDGAWHPV